MDYVHKRQHISTIETTSPTRGLLAAGLQGPGPQGYCTLRNGMPLRDMTHHHHPLVSQLLKYMSSNFFRHILNMQLSGYRNGLSWRSVHLAQRPLGGALFSTAKTSGCQSSLPSRHRASEDTSGTINRRGSNTGNSSNGCKKREHRLTNDEAINIIISLDVQWQN